MTKSAGLVEGSNEGIIKLQSFEHSEQWLEKEDEKDKPLTSPRLE